MNYYASILLYEFISLVHSVCHKYKILLQFISIIHNYLLKFCRWRAPVAKGLWAVRMVTTINPTTIIALGNRVLCLVSRRLACHGRDAAQYRIEHRTRATSASRSRTQLVQHLQGFLGHKATHLQ